MLEYFSLDHHYYAAMTRSNHHLFFRGMNHASMQLHHKHLYNIYQLHHLHPPQHRAMVFRTRNNLSQSRGVEAKYTTNKGMLPESLKTKMREAFKRSTELLDLGFKEDSMLKQREQLHTIVDGATPEKVQEMLHKLGICNT